MTTQIHHLTDENVATRAATDISPAPQVEHVDHDDVGDPPPPPKIGSLTLSSLTLVGILAIVGVFWLGWIPHQEKIDKIEERALHIRNAIPQVSVVRARQADAVSETILPGDVEAIEETTVYARTTGYLKQWLVDIGDEVEAGQLLAEIDTPEVDQQLQQARAQLGQLTAQLNTAKANSKYAVATFERYEKLLKTQSITPQDYDQQLSNRDTTAAAIEAAAADVTAGEANVHRLMELQSFSKVYAPFSGTITRRTIELGQLVTTGTNTAQPLFRIAKTDPVRVFVNVPQVYAPGVEIGLKADLIVRELPNDKFTGVVTRTARSIDQSTRTLLTEIRVPNPDHRLLTGSYVQVKLLMNRQTPPIIVPATALIVNAEGSQVATLNAGNKVHLQPVEIEGSIGMDVGIASGIKPDTLIISNPGDRLREGQQVQIDESEEPKPAQTAAPAKKSEPKQAAAKQK